jgi:DNA mismatch repair ATPase MutS
MNVFLLYKNKEGDLKEPLPWNEKALTQDLVLETLFKTMAGEDALIYEVAKKTIFYGLTNDVETILYRQNILKDCLNNPIEIRLMYDIATGAIESRKNSWFGVFTKHPSSILSSSRGMMEIFSGILKKLRSVADEHFSKFYSEGFQRFFHMLQAELTDDYFSEIQDHLEALEFPDGVLMSYKLGKGNKGINSGLHRLHLGKQSWWKQFFSKKQPGYTFYIHPRDEGGARALSELTDEGINSVANALAQSNDHILQFFQMLQAELAFYIGCMNLHEQMGKIQAPVSFPVPLPAGDSNYSVTGLYDACLSLKVNQKIVGNDLKADNKNLVMITGANQGGKSTFLRSVGLAQLMMQSGMFVAAEKMTAHICNALYTHFKREEDVTMKSGKFDEELSRMNDIISHIKPHSIFLFNESFAATNEIEGSEIAGQIVKALLEKNFRVFFVTHLYELARRFYGDKKINSVFLRANRQEDMTRTYKLTEAEPLETSFGIDVYKKVFVKN